MASSHHWTSCEITGSSTRPKTKMSWPAVKATVAIRLQARIMSNCSLTVLRDSWNPADSEPQPRDSHSRSSPCPCLVPVPAPPLPFSASQHIFHSPTLRLRPSSRVWYTQLGVKAAALLRISETRATNTAVATSFWTVISDCWLLPVSICRRSKVLMSCSTLK